MAFTYVRIANLRRRLVVSSIVLVLQDMDYVSNTSGRRVSEAQERVRLTEHVLLANHHLPASCKLDMQLWVVLDGRIVLLPVARVSPGNGTRVDTAALGQRTYAAFL